jgi:hypothetical protein
MKRWLVAWGFGGADTSGGSGAQFARGYVES